MTYHRVPRDAAQRDSMAVPLAEFRAQMAYLHEQAFQVISLTELVRRTVIRQQQPLERPTIALTLDDGYAATCHNVQEVLARYGFAATLFLTTGNVGQPDPMGSQDEGCLRWANLAGSPNLDVQAHSLTHPPLTRIPRAWMRHEIRGCKAVIEDRLARTVSHFAYPFGIHSSAVRAEVRAAGYLSGCTVHAGPAHLSPSEDLFRLHRVVIDGRDPMPVFVHKVVSGFGSRLDRLLALGRDTFNATPGAHDLLEVWRARTRPAWRPDPASAGTEHV